jgi:superfamily II RNA helicase
VSELLETCKFSPVLRVRHTLTDQLSMEHDQWVIKENILAIRQLMSDQNLQLLPDYEQRIQVLRELGFIDEGSRVELKGKVACEVSSLIPASFCRSHANLDPLC